ncbi:AmmeMemoRadiSam system protein B [bacterium]|nr:AmmeMemoRadiSam system protein B [bacterium]
MDRARLLDIDCEAFPIEHRGRPGLYIRNRRRLADDGIYVPREWAVVLPLFDGRNTVDEICQQAVGIERAIVEQIARGLDSIYLLDNQRSRDRRRTVIDAFRSAKVREPICAGGVYPDDAGELLKQIDAMYRHPHGPGPAKSFDPRASRPRSVLTPHIDYRRGKQSFAFAFKEIAERSQATIYVILATSHHSFHRFVLTAKDFRTPIGLVHTDADFVDLIADVYGHAVFEDEFAHQPEHSIELTLPLLQHALRDRPDFSIVPLLVGSFGDSVDEGRSPADFPEIARMVDALRAAEESCEQEVCYIVSGDLAHIGPKFGDRPKVDAQKSLACRSADERLLQQLTTPDPGNLFSVMHADRDERRICGFPPLWVALSAAAPRRGSVLCYDQFVDPAGSEIVSFASMVFE